MNYAIGRLFCFLFLVIIGCHGVREDVFAEKYPLGPFSLTLHEGIYELYWNFSTVDETIHFAVKVKTTGWVGFGISPNGTNDQDRTLLLHGLMETRHTFMSVKHIACNSTWYITAMNMNFTAMYLCIQDRYAERRSLPTIDPMQDWFLISAAIHNGYTELEFSRNFTIL